MRNFLALLLLLIPILFWLFSYEKLQLIYSYRCWHLPRFHYFLEKIEKTKCENALEAEQNVLNGNSFGVPTARNVLPLTHLCSFIFVLLKTPHQREQHTYHYQTLNNFIIMIFFPFLHVYRIWSSWSFLFLAPQKIGNERASDKN